jgi:rhomboid protease GluP
MFKRQTTGSVVCASCGTLVGVNDDRCYSCGRRNPGLWGFGPALRRFGHDLGFLPLVTYGCAGIFVVELLLSLMFAGPDGLMPGGNPLACLSPLNEVSFLFGSSGYVPVVGFGRWWTVFSAPWLHGGILHILFNMMAVRQLAPETAELYGAGRMVIVYTVGGVVGFITSTRAGMLLGGIPIPFLRPGAFTLGASASILGLLGACLYYGQRTGSSLVRGAVMANIGSLVIMGLLLPGIDNYAHAGGFLGGYLAGMWLDPLKPERMDHFVGAAICLLVGAIAIVVSVVTGLPIVLEVVGSRLP